LASQVNLAASPANQPKFPPISDSESAVFSTVSTATETALVEGSPPGFFVVFAMQTLGWRAVDMPGMGHRFRDVLLILRRFCLPGISFQFNKQESNSGAEGAGATLEKGIQSPFFSVIIRVSSASGVPCVGRDPTGRSQARMTQRP
jgi:hypothetical protein